MSFTRTIAAFAAETSQAALQGEAREVLKLSLLDWAACGLAGVEEPVSRAISTLGRVDGGTAEASVFGQTRRVPARAAALANGATSHALDYDDTHFDHIGHPSVVILSAALAAAEKTGASASTFLDAALVGMEVSIRVGRFLGMGHYEHGFHQTATAGAFGAAAAAARLLRLDAEQTAHALGLTATRASGLKSQFGTMGKPYNAGIAAQSGLECALLAASGFVSRPDGIECVQGFADTHAGAGDARALEGLGTDFRFRLVQHKFHACCHGTHPTLEALATAVHGEKMDIEDILSVTLSVAPKWLRVCDLPTPATGLEAKFSYRLTSAMALAGYDTGALSTFTDEVCRNPALIRLRDKVAVAPDPGFSDTEAHVVIRYGSGQETAAVHDLDAPIPLEEKARKLAAKATALVGAGKAAALQEAIANMAEGGVTGFAALLRTP